MAVWEDLLVLPFKVTASRTTTIQQRILCLSYEQIWEICTLRHPKVSIVGQAGEAAQRKNTHNPALAVVLANQGAMEGLSETSTEKTGGAEASKQPQCLVHTEAESRVRGKEKYLNIKKRTYITNSQLILYSMLKTWKLLLQEQEQNNDTSTTIIQYDAERLSLFSMVTSLLLSVSMSFICLVFSFIAFNFIFHV